MKYIKFSEHKGLNILTSFGYVFIGIFAIAYGIGYLAGTISALLK
jgi:hypothetical protein